jgi:competence protein ComEC
VFARLRATLLGFAALALGGATGALIPAGPASLTFLAVGQGDCAVFQHEGVTVLIDAGPGDEERDVGRTLVAPKLRSLGASRADLVLITHPDADHVAGLRGLGEVQSIGRVIAPAHFRGHPEMRAWLRRASLPLDRVVWIESGATLSIGKFRLHMESPRLSEGEGDNEGSLFVLIEGEGASAVLTGDAGTETELEMLRRRRWRADVLKAGHHGSKGSSSSAWLRAVAPKEVVISCGRANRYGHPAKEALDRIRNIGAQIHRTDNEGDIRYVAERGSFRRADRSH